MSRWAIALRSGEYNQGTVYLKRSYCGTQQYYCCLGVLCELDGLPHRQEAKNDLNAVTEFQFFIGGVTKYSTQVIPTGYPGLTEHARLPFDDRDGDRLTLIRLNDEGMSFAHIADVVEHFFPEL